MLSMRLVSRGNLPQYAASVQWLHTSTIALDSSSSSSDSDKKSSKKNVKAKPAQSEEQKLQSQQETTTRLNNLLDLMIKAPKVAKPIDLAIPPKQPRIKPPRYEDKIITAAKDVATSLGGDVKETESALLNKLLSSENAKSSEQTDKPKSSPVNLNELISGMKIERTPAENTVPPQMFNRSTRVQAMAKKFQSLNAGKTERRKHVPRDNNQPAEPANLFGGTKDLLNFISATKASDENVTAPKLTTWNALENREFKLAMSHPPENIFQELIQWTEQGKLWKFPIDNEQGLEEEQNVHFSEHVFMERHLKGWCPKGGPIRHFMELVCVGLSKNPYMTANEKLEHILWYQEFFSSKQDLLKEIGAIDKEIPQVKRLEAQ